MQALLLATLGSLDAAAAAADDGGEAGPMPRGTSAGRCVARRRNPLRMLHEHDGLLESVFQALLHAHMGGPPSA